MTCKDSRCPWIYATIAFLLRCFVRRIQALAFWSGLRKTSDGPPYGPEDQDLRCKVFLKLSGLLDITSLSEAQIPSCGKPCILLLPRVWWQTEGVAMNPNARKPIKVSITAQVLKG